MEEPTGLKAKLACLGLYFATTLAMQAIFVAIVLLGLSERLGLGFDLEGWVFYFCSWSWAVFLARPGMQIAVLAIALVVGPVLSWKLAGTRLRVILGSVLAALAAQVVISLISVFGVLFGWWEPM